MKKESLEDLLMDEARPVFKYLVKVGASKEDAEDIVQDTLYQAMKYIDSIHEDKVRAWLFKVAINRFYTLYKKQSRLVRLTSEEIEAIKPLMASAEDLFLTEQSKTELIQALNKLKPSYKNLMVLKYFMDLSYKEIAGILEMSEQNVKIYLYRARNTFKQIWEETHNER